ncbi:E3 ubiquitin-protein ligase FANCL-like [Stylophora pistillata]|uniref:E3 ubiquitin-protein ligase FANCL-like n=1 Tax=Stylophora pistillata TaxID=50429 RepID=UPI000C055AAE|nr:E3 ubiquitin-protein ligase FANCL-like [Stylophora pistillata]
MAVEHMAGGDKLDVLDVCPLLILQDKSKRFYDGYITVCKKSFRMSVEIPENRSLKDARIECEWKLRHLLRGYEGVLKQVLYVYKFPPKVISRNYLLTDPSSMQDTCNS